MERHNNSKGDGFLLRSTTHHQSQSSSAVDDSKSNATTSSQVVLQWGNRKRLRCMKVQANDNNNNNKSVARSDPVRRLSTRGVKSDNSNGFGHLNLRQRPSSSAHRILRNTDTMNNNNNNNNGGKMGLSSLLSSPERGGGAQDKKSKGTNNNNNNNGSYETAHDSKKGGGSSSGSDTVQAVWPPKFVIGLTNKEKEEDFLAIKGVKLPHRPKKRAKYIQRTLNLVSPGAWLCDLTLERYEVRERKVTKKRPRGLKAMENMESDSE